MKNLLMSLVAVFALFAAVPVALTAQDADKNIVELAVATDDLSTLVTAVKAADLVEALSGEGPFTVFAPTNAAFEALPEGVLAALVKPENKETLTKVLMHHVAGAQLMASDVVAGIEGATDGTLMATTLNGDIAAMVMDGKVMIKGGAGNTATVTATDIKASNGVVHLIDAVILPEGIDVAGLLKKEAMGMKDKAMDKAAAMTEKNIVQLAATTPDLSTLVTAVKAAGLVDALSGEGPFTVFAPTNAAFEALPAGVLAALVKPENKEALTKILMHHVAGAKLMASDVVAGIEGATDGTLMATTLNGDIAAMVMDGKVMIKGGAGNTATVTATDITASNGVVHLIDAVILPAGIDVDALLKGSKMNKPDMQSRGGAASAKGDLMRAEGTTIVDIASGNDNFETLTTAVVAAGLDGVLASPGEFTVFAPTDDAFDALPEGTVADLVRPENKTQLQGILQFHVIPASITAAQLVERIGAAKGYARLQTIDGQTLIATAKDGEVYITDGNGNKAKVVMTDVKGSNGIVHAIDGVLMPRSK